MLCSISFNNVLKCHYTVSTCHNLIKFEINFVLSLSNLMVRCFNCISHFLKSKANITTAVFAMVNWVKVKVTTLITCCSCRITVFIKLKEEKLTFRTYVKAVTHFSSLIHNLLKNVSWVAKERSLIICTINRANKTSCLSVLVLSPRENCPCIIIRMKIHITFIDSYEAVN